MPSLSRALRPWPSFAVRCGVKATQNEEGGCHLGDLFRFVSAKKKESVSFVRCLRGATSHHTTAQHITSHHIASHRIASHRIASHRIVMSRSRACVLCLTPTPGYHSCSSLPTEVRSVLCCCCCALLIVSPITTNHTTHHMTWHLGRSRTLVAGSSGLCRTCYFDTPLYMEETGEAVDDIPDYAPCPCCVLEVYEKPYAVDQDGEQRCESQFFFSLRSIKFFFPLRSIECDARSKVYEDVFPRCISLL